MKPGNLATKKQTPWERVRKVAAFQVLCDPNGAPRFNKAFWDVIVVKTCRDVRVLHGSFRRRKEGNKTIAFVRCYQDGRIHANGSLGVIVFPATSWLGGSLVAHEATHAAFYFAKWKMSGYTFRAEKKSYRPMFFEDEPICTVVGNLFRGIGAGLRREGVWPK